MKNNTVLWSRHLLLLLALLVTALLARAGQPDLWYWQYAYPESSTDVANIEAQIDKAITYGYTGVAFWSSAFNFMGSSVHPANNVAYVQQIIAYARSKGLKTIASVAPYGFSDDALLNNPNWAEGEHITGSQFTVNSSKTALLPVNSFGGLANPGFEAGKTGWFGYNDPNMGIDTTVFHTGAASGYVTNAAGNARFQQALNVTPWRQYHGSVWIKTANFTGYTQVEVWDPSSNISLFFNQGAPQSTQDWTRLDFTFNSRSTTAPLFLFGVWGGSKGTIWYDDALIEETSLVYVLRRPGTPLKAYNPLNPGTVFQEGTDFNQITDPQLSSVSNFGGYYHAPAVVSLPASTSLRPGQTIAIDYYAAQPVGPYGDVGLCLTETGAQNWLKQNAQSIVGNMPTGMGYLLSYDEMRHMDSCASCKARGLAPGQLLASHVTNTANMYLGLDPSSALYTWGDMFDPFQNAVNNYYFVEGDLAGSWSGVPTNVTIMNWNLGNLKSSLTWFSGQNAQQPNHYKQVIAGYYDSGDGTTAATTEIQQALGIPGVTGLMYTTWYQDYSQMQAFANAAKANWPAYLASVSSAAPNVTSQFAVSKSSILFNRGTNLYSQTVHVTNNGPALASAAYVLDALPTGISMYQPDGATSAALPTGSPYKELGAVAAGATVTFTLEFTRTGNAALKYTTRLLGAGSR